MENTEENRSRILLTRLKPAEFNLLNKQFEKTRFRKLSEYVRSILLQKPVTVFHRDKSMDEILEELVLLRKELNSIGVNINQAVHKINGATNSGDSSLWLTLLGELNAKLEPSVSQIKERMDRYAELWSQKLRAGKA